MSFLTPALKKLYTADGNDQPGEAADVSAKYVARVVYPQINATEADDQDNNQEDRDDQHPLQPYFAVPHEPIGDQSIEDH